MPVVWYVWPHSWMLMPLAADYWAYLEASPEVGAETIKGAVERGDKEGVD